MELVYKKIFIRKKEVVFNEHCFFFLTFLGKITSILDFFTGKPKEVFFVVMY